MAEGGWVESIIKLISAKAEAEAWLSLAKTISNSYDNLETFNEKWEDYIANLQIAIYCLPGEMFTRFINTKE